MKTIKELEAWISLWRVPGVGPKAYQKLLASFSNPLEVFESKLGQLTDAGLSQKLANTILEHRDSKSASPDIEWLNSSDSHFIITIQCEEYSELLKQITNPPPLLYVKGNCSLLHDPQLAIIGSRNPTKGGNDNAYSFAKYLGETGFCITSGLALGIDGTAHKGAIDGNGPTIAVIATGIDRVYPASHRDLAHSIAETGAIVSEFPIGTQPKPENFPRRNRIISGLSYGTLVIEAALKSGSLITARLAMEQNREVFAIPGSIHNPLARGCHSLIRQGAKLVETANDVIEEMSDVVNLQNTPSLETTNHPSNNEKHDQEIEDENSAEYQSLVDQMGFDPVHIDQLVIETGQSPETLSTMLLMLELQNRVSSNGGGTYTRLK